jgi:hypothetical protein
MPFAARVTEYVCPMVSGVVLMWAALFCRQEVPMF